MLIFAPHVVQTFPEPAMHSDLMANFVKGYLGKKYGVRLGILGLSVAVQFQNGEIGYLIHVLILMFPSFFDLTEGLHEA